MLDDLTEPLLDRYLTGACTSEEEARVRRWADAAPKHAALLAALRAEFPRRRHGDQVAAAYERVIDRAARETSTVTRPPQAAPVRIRRLGHNAVPRRTWTVVVTSIALAAALLIVGLVTTFHSSYHGTSRALATYVTANGERARVELKDGTIVMLNVASRLRVPEDFGPKNRTVWLDGEAYFNVAHVAGAPFTVQAGATHTRVLGTEFVVRSYQPADVRVAVRAGKIAVNGAVLGANDIAVAGQNGVVTVRRNQRIDAAFGVAEGRLVLTDVPLREAAADLERWYDVKLRFGDSTVSYLPISAVLPSGSAGDLVEVLRLTFGVRVVQQGRILTINDR